ncbi:MAG: hypothetical protein H0V29_07780 [Thermoleophilaceae bacterium]|nr:hypothetical protein [Thermoleophilaceae bacterium]
MANYEMSRTLVKSPPELWDGLGTRLENALGEEARVQPTEAERSVAWEVDGAHGTVALEPSGWGTKVTLTAEVEEQVAAGGFWGRFRAPEPDEPKHADMDEKLDGLLDDLGFAHKKPFSRE